MIGLCVALTVMGLGFGGPAFRWRGALLLVLVMLSAGCVATAQAASEAAAQGFVFRVTPASLLIGLLGQAGFVAIFYLFARGIRWGLSSIRGRGAGAAIADCEGSRG
jgi:hypothetical protein